MNDNSRSIIQTLFLHDRENIAEEWMAEIAEIVAGTPHLMTLDAWKIYAERMFDEIVRWLTEYHPNVTAVRADKTTRLGGLVIELSAKCAKLGMPPADTVRYVISLKKVLMRRALAEPDLAVKDMVACFSALDDLLDSLSLLTFETYVDSREKIIAQQSLSLLELSSPAVLLWNQVILLPLIGLIDTLRARQFTERLLEAIARHEAAVSIIDVTGVPIFDTGVAKHIMKAVDAAQLLGSRVVMTGLSPEGAQTLTKLGIAFDGVISRASLRAGMAEALKMIGCRIVDEKAKS
ncbi:STAS domain-containing protein [Methylotuvimicrobium buryatense]|uniref:STAS domain-containing protein n=1 Tax=Methylotuvimicrobium buryatense TaxID=95641 RepID=A0A4P9UN52_METBY|nr:STAS domain-containing protein [Methylotuvimicrobium buryatense]QCW82637.1 STAS domain-containing protein [Methylotuvimicrobium buryatense]